MGDGCCSCGDIADIAFRFHEEIPTPFCDLKWMTPEAKDFLIEVADKIGEHFGCLLNRGFFDDFVWCDESIQAQSNALCSGFREPVSGYMLEPEFEKFAYVDYKDDSEYRFVVWNRKYAAGGVFIVSGGEVQATFEKRSDGAFSVFINGQYCYSMEETGGGGDDVYVE